MIKEEFLHFIWRLQYFEKRNLTTASGEKITILHPGVYNTDAGPDFTNARIKIGEIEWYGNVEIHTYSSDWNLHKHTSDEAYNNVILHVAYANDEPARREEGTLIPTIELKDRIDEKVILKYTSIVSSKSTVACEPHLANVTEITRQSMLERMISERLMEKTEAVHQLYHRNKGDWQETCYQLLAQNFGFKLNGDPFLRLAKSMPFKILLKHRDNVEQIEALLFGQAGFLEDRIKDDYYLRLKREYDFLSQKYSLREGALKKHEWKFLRIRPANFPTVRIAQFAALIYRMPDFFTSVPSMDSVSEIYQKFADLEVSAYWKSHFAFGEDDSSKSTSSLGKESINNIIINTIAVMYFAIGTMKDDEGCKEKAVAFLDIVPPESNKIIKLWRGLGLRVRNGMESQGALHLYNNYCTSKRCLDCTIGASVLQTKSGKAKSLISVNEV